MKLCLRTSSASNVYLYRMPVKHGSLECKHMVKLPSKPHKRTQIKTFTHPFFRAMMVNVRLWCEIQQLFSLWSTSLSRRGESHEISLRLSPSQLCLCPSSSSSLSPRLNLSSRLTPFFSQSEPQAQAARLACHQLGPVLVRPETIGGHEAVCKALAKPVC